MQPTRSSCWLCCTATQRRIDDPFARETTRTAESRQPFVVPWERTSQPPPPPIQLLLRPPRKCPNAVLESGVVYTLSSVGCDGRHASFKKLGAWFRRLNANDPPHFLSRLFGTGLCAHDEAGHGPCSAGEPSGALVDSFPHHDPRTTIFSGAGDSAEPAGIDAIIIARAVQQATSARNPLARRT